MHGNDCSRADLSLGTLDLYPAQRRLCEPHVWREIYAANDSSREDVLRLPTLEFVSGNSSKDMFILFCHHIDCISTFTSDMTGRTSALMFQRTHVVISSHDRLEII